MAGALEAGVGAPMGQATEPAGILGQDPVLQEELAQQAPRNPCWTPLLLPSSAQAGTCVTPAPQASPTPAAH